MWNTAWSYIQPKYRATVQALTAKKPHFDFISAHYVVIIGGTIVASILLYGAGRGELAYIDALLFASGANTQAGLNPVDLNKLNTFQQIVMYLFPMLANPITLHGCVVALRLYWFEKRFQGIVRDARKRRPTLSKSKSKAREDVESGMRGVNGRHITVVPHGNGRAPRVANDGVLLRSETDAQEPAGSSSSGDGTDNTITDSQPASRISHPSPEHGREVTESRTVPADTPEDPDRGRQRGHDGHAVQSSITFADAVKRSDDTDDDGDDATPIQLRQLSNTEHIAILERQRQQDNDEVLRIPGPRDAERGLGPRRLMESDENEDNNTLAAARTRDSRFESGIDPRNLPRNPTITFEEPHHPKADAASTTDSLEAKPSGGALRFRRLRAAPREDARGQEGDKGTRQSRMGRARTFDTIRSALSREKEEVKDMPYLSYTPTMARNSNFIGLTLEQREELGGIEYRSLRTLAFILLGYFWGFQMIALSFLLPYILHKEHYGDIVRQAGVSRTWWGFFTANGAFMDLGFTLTPDSMISFATSQYVLTVMWWFIIIGNTGFPVMLRFVIWILAKLTPRGSGLWEELRFLLDHPRRCFTLLFPSGANWWLFWILVILNATDLIFFIILDLNADVVSHLSVGSRVVNGLFHAASTRTAGFASLPLSELHPAIPVLYLIMMYISVFPIAISIRRTNVYEEKSLGMYPKKDDDEDLDNENSPVSYVSSHLRRQLSFDLWYVFLGFFLLAITEGPKLQRKEFSLFDVLFEAVSAYGTVGLSMGVAGINASLCSQFSTVGKLLIIALEIRGRHRGLPYGLDRAVILPSEARFEHESEQPPPSFARTNTGASNPPGGGIQRRDSSITRGRGRSLSVDRDHRIITRLLHPGPAVPPGVMGPKPRTKSGGSDMMYPIASNNSRYPQSFQTAIQDDEDDNREEVIEYEEAADGLAPLRTTDSRPHPRRADTAPPLNRE